MFFKKAKKMPKTPLELLAEHLHLHHPDYTVDDVVLSKTKGYLQCIKPCPREECSRLKHYHTIAIAYLGCPKITLRRRNPYLFWEKLHEFLPVEEPNKDYSY